MARVRRATGKCRIDYREKVLSADQSILYIDIVLTLVLTDKLFLTTLQSNEANYLLRVFH